MDPPDSFTLLSAAECAARTGLSTRALRLYEEHGLLTPRRSASGWRQYGAAELVRLNVIALLKTAGLTLVQIAAVTRSVEEPPNLNELLTLQLQSWKSRRADAERGQRIAEAALARLASDRTLTVDDLCNLIRSLEMTQPPESPTARPGEPDSPTLDVATLDQYAGLYQAGEWSVITLRREDTRLLLEFAGREPLELRATSECDFDCLGPAGFSVTIDRDTHGNVTGLRLRVKGGDMAAKRIDAATADLVRARLATRIQNATPLSGSEAAVRRLVAGILCGEPPYEAMHPALAYATRWQLPQLRAMSGPLGAIESIQFQGVGSQGWDVYDLHHEHGTLRCRIILRPDGLITGALLVIKDGPVTLGP